MKRFRFSVVLFAALLIAGLFAVPSHGQMTTAGETRKFITPREIHIDYAAREQAASPVIKAKLLNLRRDVTARKLKFTVGYTAALDFDLRVITGLVPPANLEQLIQEHNAQIAPLLPRLPAIPAAAPCSATLQSFDWRRAGGTTPVRDQGPCGSCWAFGTHGAFEGSWRLVNGTVIDSSEQDTLDCSGKGNCKGGWWAFSYLTDKGSATEAAYPYTHEKHDCRHNVQRPYRAEIWGYVSPLDLGNRRKHVEQLKQALCRFGPLAVTVNATDAFHAYTGGVFDEFASGDINHAVTLIGWDDNRQSWIIKNSWGTGWGETCGFGTERGYMWIAYGSNKVGAKAAWVYAHPQRPGGARDYEAVVYEHRDFGGKSLVYEVRPGMCQRIEPRLSKAKMNDKLTSVRVGDRVNAMIFEHTNYDGRHMRLVSSVNNLSPYNFNDKVSSLVVFPKTTHEPQGVWLIGSKEQFFPVGEDCRRADHARVAHHDDALRLWITGSMRVTVYEHTDFKGRSAVFQAGPGGGRYELPQELRKKVSSLRIEYVGAPPVLR